MATINRVDSVGAAKQRITGSTFIADHAGMSEKDYFGRRAAMNLIIAAAKVGMFAWSAGNPANQTDGLAGMFCLDTTNDLLYVCTNRSSGTWTLVQE